MRPKIKQLKNELEALLEDTRALDKSLFPDAQSIYLNTKKAAKLFDKLKEEFKKEGIDTKHEEAQELSKISLDWIFLSEKIIRRFSKLKKKEKEETKEKEKKYLN